MRNPIDIDMCPNYSGHPEGYEVVPYDVEKAKEYLAASNYDGEEFEILVQSGTMYDTVAQIVQYQLMEVGINCTINAVDSATFTDLWYAGKYDAMIKNTNSSLLDADGFLNFFMATDYAPTNNNQHPRTQEIYDLGHRRSQGAGRGARGALSSGGRYRHRGKPIRCRCLPTPIRLLSIATLKVWKFIRWALCISSTSPGRSKAALIALPGQAPGKRPSQCAPSAPWGYRLRAYGSRDSQVFR